MKYYLKNPLENTVSVVFLTTLLVCTAGCFDSDAMSSDYADESPEQLSVSPKGPIKVGVFETIPFTVKLSDGYQHPIAGTPIVASFTGNAYNATLTPSDLITDSKGEGEFLFTAPHSAVITSEIQFDVRFQSPQKEIYVPVTVDPDSVSLSVEIDYDGTRELAAFEAFLYDASDTSESREIQTLSLPIGQLPTHITFSGLVKETRYRVQINGKNGNDEIRATGTATDLVPNSGAKQIVLENTRLGISGTFNITTHLETEGALDWTVEQLTADIPALTDPAVAILDGIATELASDAFAYTSFNTERESQNLDAALAGHLSDLENDFLESIDDVHQSMRAALSDITFRGTIELAKTDTESFDFFHLIESISFDSPDASNPLIYKIDPLLQDLGTSFADWGEDDTLVIHEHLINMGLGNPLQLLLSAMLSEHLSVTALDRVLTNAIDCDGDIADFLTEALADLVIRESIERGCHRAITEASQRLEENKNTLNQNASLKLSGTCVLDIPDTGNLIEDFKDGQFDVTWTAGTASAPPMHATFNAARVDE